MGNVDVEVSAAVAASSPRREMVADGKDLQAGRVVQFPEQKVGTGEVALRRLGKTTAEDIIAE